MTSTSKRAAILLTGTSGVGKSAVLVELACRGFATIDTDLGEWTVPATGADAEPEERVWNEPLMARLLAAPRAVPLIVAGTVANQGRLYDRFDAVVLLTVDIEVALERVQRRTTNPFGSTLHDREKIRRDTAEVVPLLHRGATHVIDASRPIADVAAEVERIARG